MNSEKWRRVKNVLEETLEMPGAARAGYLTDRCGGDEDLRREVEVLLAYENQAEADVLENLRFDVMFDANADSLVGKRIDKYRILEPLGAGGMGAVYLAQRADGAFEQRVALKVIKRGMDTDAILRRFQIERQILSDLNHPHITRLLDGGSTADGLPFFVMEHIEGQPLDEFCDERKLSTNQRLKLFRDVCSAVSHAHRHSIIHRDLKPSNILVTEDGAPKLLDFGIAKILRSSAAQTTQVTETIFRALTPEYASPEQIKGERVTASSDVYSLGVMLYELLTGHSPYRLASRHSGEITKAICEDAPERPSTAVNRVERDTRAARANAKVKLTREYIRRTRGSEPEILSRTLRGDLDNIVLMALSKEPARRYASVEEFAADINRYLENAPVRARRTTAARRSAAFVRRNLVRNWRASLAFLLLVPLVAGAASGVSIYLLKPRSEPATAAANRSYKSIAVLPFKYVAGATNAEADNPLLGVGLADYLIGRLGQTKKIEVRPMSAVQTYSGSEVSPRPVGQNLGVDLVLSGSLRRTGENVSIDAELIGVKDGGIIWTRLFSGKSDEVMALQNSLSEAVAQALALPLNEDEQENLKSLRTSSARAYEFHVRGRYFWSLRTKGDYEKAIDYFNQAVALDPNYADAYAGLADAYALLACVVPFDRRPERMQSAKDFAERALSLDATLAAPHATLGFIRWHYDWDWEASEREFKKALALNPSYATAHQWYSLLLIRLKRFDEAVAEIERALALDPFSFAMQQDYAEILFVARRYDETIEAARKSLEMSPANLDMNGFVENAYYHKKDYPQYLKLLEERVNRAGRTVAGLKELENAYLHLDRENDLGKIAVELKSRGERAGFGRFKSFAEKKRALDLSNKKNAFEWLEYEYKNRGAGISAIHIRPEWDWLRNEPRLQEYIRRMNLSEYAAKDN